VNWSENGVLGGGDARPADDGKAAGAAMETRPTGQPTLGESRCSPRGIRAPFCRCQSWRIPGPQPPAAPGRSLLGMWLQVAPIHVSGSRSARPVSPWSRRSHAGWDAAGRRLPASRHNSTQRTATVGNPWLIAESQTVSRERLPRRAWRRVPRPPMRASTMAVRLVPGAHSARPRDETWLNVRLRVAAEMTTFAHETSP
jgi:hypothetical protein